jgi:HNH endonuclease
MSNKILHKRWRKEFNASVFHRDNNKCRICGKDGVDAHHITDRHDLPNGGYVASNGILLCETCHIKAGEHHITNGKSWPKGFHPNDLYDLICSSYNKAYEDSNNLCLPEKE